MLEKDIESYLVKQVRLVGGKAYKFVSPGQSGVPDRIAVFPGGKIVFVELKAPGKQTTANQRRQMQLLRELGCTVELIDSKGQIDMLVRECCGNYAV